MAVFVHEAIERGGGVIFRCTLSGSEAERGLEIPEWMFDRVACAERMALSGAPRVSVAALSALVDLLVTVPTGRAASATAPRSGASRLSREENRGGVDVDKNSEATWAGETERSRARPGMPAASDGVFQLRHRDRHSDMAGPARRDTAHADRSDGTPAPGPCRPEPSLSRDGRRS